MKKDSKEIEYEKLFYVDENELSKNIYIYKTNEQKKLKGMKLYFSLTILSLLILSVPHSFIMMTINQTNIIISMIITFASIILSVICVRKGIKYWGLFVLVAGVFYFLDLILKFILL